MITKTPEQIQTGLDLIEKYWEGQNDFNADFYKKGPGKRDYLLLVAIAKAPLALPELIALGWDVNQGGENNWTPLMQAVQYDRMAEFHLLLKAGADVFAVTQANGGKDSLLHIAANSNAEVIPFLIASGLGIETQDDKENTPLHIAANFDCDALLTLIHHGANLEARNDDGNTPIFYGVSFPLSKNHNTLTVFDALIEAGVQINIQNNIGQTL